MEFKSKPSIIHTGGGADLAFAMVVLVSYLATFSTLPPSSNLHILSMITMGIAYVANGIYGYAFCTRSGRLSYQLTYFASQILLGGLIVYLSKGAGLNAILLMPLAGQTAVILPQNWMVYVNAAVLGTYTATVRSFTPNWGDIWVGLQTFLAGQIFIVFFTQMAVNEEQSRHEAERLAADLAAANQRLREYALQIEELATARERNRLAREIHDGLGHFLTTIHMQIQAAQAVQSRSPEKAHQLLESAQKLTQEALDDVRRSVAALRLPAEEARPLPERIEMLLKSVEVSGLTPSFSVEGQVHPLSPKTELTLFRTAQEALNNTCKHAHASRIWVKLDYSTPGWVRLSIRDDGTGTPSASSSGFGLIGLQERANLLNGTFRAVPTPGKGFTIEIELPEKEHAYSHTAG